LGDQAGCRISYREPPQQEIFMKLITSLSISAFVLMPAIAVAENSPSSTGSVSEPNQEQRSDVGGQKFYPDWGAVKKVPAPPSQKGASVKPNEASNQQKPESMGTNGNSSSSAKDQPGLMEKAKELMGTVTGRTSSNESESAGAPKAGAMGQGNPPMGESKNMDMSAGKPKVLGTLTGVIEIAPGNESAANDVVTNTTAALQGRTSVPITIKGELKIDQSMNSNEGAAGTSSR
jgi:hypothetical protein